MNVHTAPLEKKRFLIFITTILLFFLFLPISLGIDFKQNDDWHYYNLVENFQNGNYKLDPITSVTFYTQGFIGLIFSKLFSVEKLPILTLIISIANFLIFYKIIEIFQKKPYIKLFAL